MWKTVHSVRAPVLADAWIEMGSGVREPKVRNRAFPSFLL